MPDTRSDPYQVETALAEPLPELVNAGRHCGRAWIIHYLDYLAGLLSEGKINRVTDLLTCDIWNSSDQAFKVERGI